MKLKFAIFLYLLLPLQLLAQGACMAIPLSATDEYPVTYSAIGCISTEVGEVNGEWGMLPHFFSLPPQKTNIVDYSPKYSADVYDDEFYFVTSGTDIPYMDAGKYSISFLANDMPSSTSYDYLLDNPFYSNYSVWDATVEIVGGVAYTLTTLSPDGGGGFNVTGGTDTGIQEMDVRTESVVYDLLGRELSADDDCVGIVIKGGKKFYRK